MIEAGCPVVVFLCVLRQCPDCVTPRPVGRDGSLYSLEFALGRSGFAAYVLSPMQPDLEMDGYLRMHSQERSCADALEHRSSSHQR